MINWLACERIAIIFIATATYCRRSLQNSSAILSKGAWQKSNRALSAWPCCCIPQHPRRNHTSMAARRAVSCGRHASGPTIPLAREAWSKSNVRTIRGEKPPVLHTLHRRESSHNRCSRLLHIARHMLALSETEGPNRGPPFELNRLGLRAGSRLAYSGARRTHNHKEDGDEPRQGTRSIRARRYPSHPRHTRRRTYCDSRARIRLRR
jgi:hypothetical protein